MRTTLNINDQLLAEGQRLTGVTEKTALVNAGLKALVERENARRLVRLGGSEPGLGALPPGAVAALEEGTVPGRPFIIGELACGELRQQGEILPLMDSLPAVLRASEDEARTLIETWRLMGRGIGYIDVHLLAAAVLTGDGRLWTRDRRLAEVADDLGIGFR